ncbi:MAG: ABC transporter permease [Candidatus Tectomicrobia bacterium RIFCSPLOWO2_12_FULL_69_37]|nr:MAG: ABC transporter permease [Candidatus Tectomicrobia bacterium RIFCSPLOWO2_12_FULL_69_37]
MRPDPIALKGVRFLGQRALDLTAEAGRMGIFLGASLGWLLLPPYRFPLLLRQMLFVGAGSLSIVLLTGLFTGMVLGLQGFYTLQKFGSEGLLGPAVALSLIRELGPVLTALVVAGRAGSAMAAEIGIMVITEQVDALQSMAVNPIQRLASPRLLAGVLTFPLLGALFNVVGIFGGYLVGVQLLGLSSGTYFGEMQAKVEMADIVGGMEKSLVFGLLVTWICCYKGYTCGHGAEGVGRATTSAVVLSSVLILVGDYFLTSVLF